MATLHGWLAVPTIAGALLFPACGESTAPADPTHRFASVVAGGDFSCGLGSDSLAYCWGLAPALGYSPNVNQARVQPTHVRGDRRFVRLEAGGTKACGFDVGGAVFCWGSELLGAGSPDRDSVPQLVGGGLVLESLAIGVTNACGIVSDGVAYCWGLNDVGQVGTGSQSAYEVLPRAVAGGALRFKQVSPGVNHACGIGLDDHVYCWGNNTFSQLGTDSSPDICFPGNPPQCAFVPVPVADTQKYRAIAAGVAYTCGLTLTGQAFCWGTADYGELGTAFRHAPTPEAVVTSLRFTTLVSGGLSTCALIPSGAAYCWGNNEYGQLGTSNPTYTCPALSHPRCSPFPEPVSGGLVFRSLSVHRWHACGIASDGLAYCWGSGNWGQMGDGLPHDHISYVPVRVIDQAASR